MAFAAVKVFPPSSGSIADGGPGSIGGGAFEIWEWTQLNSDVGGTFVPGVERIVAVTGSVTTAAANNGKTVGVSFVQSTGVVTVVTDDAGGTQSPVKGYVIVVGESR